MTFVIGVDGGGSVMRAVLLDARGREISRAEAPGAVVTLQRPDAAAVALSEAVRGAVAGAELVLPGSVLWAGLSGAGREGARQAVTQELERAGLADRVFVGSDVEAAFHGAFTDGPGVLLIAGTGSIAWARNPTGEVVRVGGWGQHLGDEGSGYALGLGALKAVVRAEDGRAPPTILREGVLRFCGIETPDALIPWAATGSKADLARLVPLVTAAAGHGDAAARTLLECALNDLEEHVATVLSRGGPWSQDPELVLWGGLIERGGPLRAALRERLAKYAVVFGERDPDPALGAATMALAELRSQAP